MPPAPVVSTPTFTPASPTAGATFTLQAGVTSTLGVMSVEFEYQASYGQWSEVPMALIAGDPTDGTWSVSIGPLPPGILSYTVMVVDSLGQAPWAPPAQLTLDMPPPPVVAHRHSRLPRRPRARRSRCRPV